MRKHPGWTEDHEQLRRVFDNLLRNALEAGASHVAVTARPEAGALQIAVRDDGPGIPAKVREHLFLPFSGSQKVQGSGLGLAIARELLAAEGGTIALEHTGPEGTVFHVTLPAAVRDQAA